MKPTPKLLTQLSVFALGTCLALAQEGAPKPEGGGGRLADFLKRADTNADGKISQDEFNDFSKRDTGDRFAKMDANSDGFVDQTEMGQIAERLREGMRRPGGEGAGSGREGGFRRPPSGAPEGEGKGPRPEGERPAPPPEGERRPAPPEGQRPPGGPGQGGPGIFNLDDVYGRMDKNADGNVDKDEYLEFSKQEIEGRFTRMDENQDGKVSKDEMKAGMDRMRNMMRGPGGPGGPGSPGGMRRPGGEGGGEGGFRRPPGGEGGGEGGFRRPPQQGDTGRPRPEAEVEAPKKDPA